MMQANELRIENLVRCKNVVDSEIFIVESIIRGGEIQLSNRIGRFVDVKIGDILPIMLSEEWMTQLGFAKNDDNIWCAKWMKGYINPNNIFCLIEHEENHLNIKYVHQLQNLYFALTGKELSRKEKENR